MIAVCAQEDSFIDYLFDRLPRNSLDDFEKLSSFSLVLCICLGGKPTVLVMPSLNLSISVGPSRCSHSGRRLKTIASADFSDSSLL